MKIPELTLADFKNYKKKLVVANVTKDTKRDEVKTYFGTILATLRKSTDVSEEVLNDPDIDMKEEKKLRERLEAEKQNPIKSLGTLTHPHTGDPIYILEFILREDLELCLKVDGFDWKGKVLQVNRVKQFLQKLKDSGVSKRFEDYGKSVYDPDAPSIRIYMGNIPKTMRSNEVRSMVNKFGLLKNFNLVNDPNNDGMNKGYAFFEYYNAKCSEKAIRMLDGFEIGFNKLKVSTAQVDKRAKDVAPQIGFRQYIKDEE